MAIVKCKECGENISNKAETCPSCGIIIKKQLTSFQQYSINYCIVFFGFFFCIWFFLIKPAMDSDAERREQKELIKKQEIKQTE